MPFDATAAPAITVPGPAAHGFRPFRPCKPPPRINELTDDDERTLAPLETGWAHLRGPSSSEDDDLTTREDDDDEATAATRAAKQPRRGLLIAELTEAAQHRWPEMDRPTLVALMADVGHLVHVPEERRYVLSREAVEWGVGRNVRPKRGHLFPIIYPEHVGMVLSSLDWDWLKEQVASLPDERERRAFVVKHCRHLPVATLMRLSGTARRTLMRELARHR